MLPKSSWTTFKSVFDTLFALGACHVAIIGGIVYKKIIIFGVFENISASFWYFFVKSFLVARSDLGSVRWCVPRHQLSPLLLPLLCNIRGACLGKYWGWDYEKNGNGLTSMILDNEYFAIFYKNVGCQRVLWRHDSQQVILKLRMVRKS